jgi:hypothetical protein
MHDEMHYHPHAICFMLDERLIALHRITDILIGLAYFSIPLMLFYAHHVALKQEKEHPVSARIHRLIGVLFNPELKIAFAMFILFCGSGHLLDAWNLTHTAYWAKGLLNIGTVLSSFLAAIMLFPRVRVLAKMPELIDDFIASLRGGEPDRPLSEIR